MVPEDWHSIVSLAHSREHEREREREREPILRTHQERKAVNSASTGRQS